MQNNYLNSFTINNRESNDTMFKQPFSYDISNKENLNNNFDEEPMEVDPGTPLFTRQLSSQQQQQHQQQQQQNQQSEQDSNILQISPPTNRKKNDPNQPTSPNSIKANNKPVGAKIVKSIRPAGPKVTRPPPASNEAPNDSYSKQFDFDEFADINPFQSKPKIGFDSANSATSSSSSISNEPNQNENEINPFQSRRGLARSPSPTQELLKSPSVTSNENINGSNNDLINDEWESHKKRPSASANRKSSISVNTNTQNQQQINNNQLSSPTTNQSSSTSVVSSTTDLSTASSVSPLEHQQANTNSDKIQSQESDNNNTKEEEEEDANNYNNNTTTNTTTTTNNNNINDDPFNTPPKTNNKITSRNSISISVSNTDDDFMATGQLVDFENENNQSNNNNSNASGVLTADSVIFDSIFSNDTEFQSFLDLLETKEKDNAIKKSPSKYSEFARKSLYLQFDPIIQNCRSLSPEKIKRLSIIRDKQESIKFFLSEIAEEENEQIPTNTAVNSNSNPNSNLDSNSSTHINNQTLVDLVETNHKTNSNNQTLDLYSNSSSNLNKTQESNENNISKSSKNSIVMETSNLNENHLTNTDIIVNNDKSNGGLRNAEDDEQIIDNLNNEINKSHSNNSINVNANSNHHETFNSKRKSSLSSNNSFDHVKSNDTTHGNNSSILDLDRMSISNQRNHLDTHEGDSFKLLSDDSMLDDIQLFNKQNSTKTQTNGVLNKPKVGPIKLINDKKTSLTSAITTISSPTHSSTATSVTAISDDDLSSSSTFSSNQSMSKLINELNMMKEKEKGYLDQIRSLDEENKKFRVIVVEFETIIQNMDNNREESEAKLKSEILELTKERDHLQEDVIGVERAFDDLHRRFEKLKTKVEEFKKNEEGLQKAIESYKQQLDKEKLKYSTLKKHAEEKLEFANGEIEKLRKSTSIELQTLKAELRKAEIKISSLELTVQQKDQENTELTNLLEDLLNKVKPNN